MERATQGNPAIRLRLEEERKALLDLTARNRLVNTSRDTDRGSILNIVQERSDDTFRILVTERRKMTFEAARTVWPPPEADNDETRARYSDRKLQTRVASDPLQSKLLKIYRDARTYEEEQGVNILYLALGFLRWFEEDKSEVARHSPLILVPVNLVRNTGTDAFSLQWSEAEITTNLSMQARLKEDFGIEIPDLPDAEEIVPAVYFDQVAAAVQGRKRMDVLRDDIALSFFSFAKYLMYRDLDPEAWTGGEEAAPLDENPLVRGLLSAEGVRSEPALWDDDRKLDEALPALDLVHIYDADSSQAVVIEEAKRGRNLVVQGPPGTGKSQTICNLIAAAVKAGKRVLFVAEKSAALEVVERRLANAGLKHLCLVLHSHKANKREVAVQLAETLGLAAVAGPSVAQAAEQLEETRDKLNRHAQFMHKPWRATGLTPFDVVARSIGLMERGVRVPTYDLQAAHAWSAADIDRRRRLADEFATALARAGLPAAHPWRGLFQRDLIPADVDRLRSAWVPLARRIDALRADVAALAATLECDVPRTAAAVSALVGLARYVASAPDVTGVSLDAPEWEQWLDEIRTLVRHGLAYQKGLAAAALAPREELWSTDLIALRPAIEAGARLFLWRWFPGFRRARRRLQSLVADPLPTDASRLAEALDGLIAAHRARAQILAREDLAKRAFGSAWRGDETAWPRLDAIAKWVASAENAQAAAIARRHLGKSPDRGALLARALDIEGRLRGIVDELTAIVGHLAIDTRRAFGPVADALACARCRSLLATCPTCAPPSPKLIALPLADLSARLVAWGEQSERLHEWQGLVRQRESMDLEGLSEAATACESGAVALGAARDSFELALCSSLIKDMASVEKEFRTFDGASHEQVRRRFAELDARRIEMARLEVAQAHLDSMPRGTGEHGEIGLVRQEARKQRRHLPLRQLLRKAGRAVQAIKPVFMMSPLSVAQYLEPGAVKFDLLLIDEASQVRPVDALGAIARCRQVIVVGDDKQLPPTHFFMALGSDSEPVDEEIDPVAAKDLESVLDLCLARGFASRMLLWHYRSRHESLIAVSNREFYDSRLHLVPSPSERDGVLGLAFHHVTGATYARGGASNNPVEAAVVARAVAKHAHETPDLSLGVGAFSVSQRDALLDEVEKLRRTDPVVERFLTRETVEPFFVKNLETIQGDERDVILVSVGYGRDANGFFSMNFGPVSQGGGERRLNVLITRARRRCEVYSSITDEDIDLERAGGRGPEVLKAFLRFARTGQFAAIESTERGFGSPFEEAVARALQSRGFQAVPQVGLAGFFIDLAVRDAANPGRFLLGIECDGAAYHAARWARDRDRLRQQVLEGQGWRLHRIWSTDWYRQPKGELEKLLRAIDAAKGGVAMPEAEPEPAAPVVAVASELKPAVPTTPYRETVFEDGRLPSSTGALIALILRTEGPIHRAEVARRVAALSGMARASSRVVQAVEGVLSDGLQQGRLVCEGDFFWLDGAGEPPIRDRSDAEGQVRKAEMLPPPEIRRAILATVEANVGVGREEAVSAVARLLGFRSTGSGLREAIAPQIDTLLDLKRLEERHGGLHAAPRRA